LEQKWTRDSTLAVIISFKKSTQARAKPSTRFSAWMLLGDGWLSIAAWAHRSRRFFLIFQYRCLILRQTSMYRSQSKGKSQGGAAAVQAGGGAVVVRTPPEPKKKPTPSTKKAPIQSGKGLHWTDNETEVLLDIVEEVQPTGKLPV